MAAVRLSSGSAGRMALALAGVVAIVGCGSVSLEDRGIQDMAAEQARCAPAELPVYEDAQYNREVGANDYLAYAVASANVYAGGGEHGFLLEKHTPAWTKTDHVETPGGLVLDGYHREDDPTVLRVLVAFRGTELDDARDFLANLSWLTGWLPLRDQYDEGREAFAAIRRRALERARGRRVSFITTGHSLGGGIAQHVALGFPCTEAAVFNTSFVINKFRLGPPVEDARIVHIHEDRDELTRVYRTFSSDRETATHRHYPVNLIPRDRFQHPIVGLAVGMARMVIDCQVDLQRKGCAIPKSDRRARNLYCPTWGQLTHDTTLCPDS